MQKPISWFEIPTTNFERARHFYERTLGVELRLEKNEAITMGIFPYADDHTGGCLTSSEHFKPSANGTIVYLFAGDDLAKPLAQVPLLGGEIVLPKTSIGEHGYIALFKDSEGNTVGLHSLN